MDCRKDQPVKTSTNRLARITRLTLSKPCRRSGSATAVDLRNNQPGDDGKGPYPTDRTGHSGMAATASKVKACRRYNGLSATKSGFPRGEGFYLAPC
jgi:hypothetical protein